MNDGRHGNDVAGVRARALSRGQHLAVALNDSAYVNRSAFAHRCSVSGDATYFPEEGVSVCAMSFIPHLAALAVGFNYGAWQLWLVFFKFF